MSGQRVALVTGAARGIGAAVVGRLAGRGHHVYALDCCDGPTASAQASYALATRADLDAVADASPGRVTPVVADVCEAVQVEAAVHEIRRAHGGLDTVVAAAAVIAGGAPLWETEPETLHRLWRADAVGVWNTAHATVPLLLSREGDGATSFVAVASAAGEHGLWGLSAYCMAKHAVVGLVRALAAELRGTGVTASAVSPGSTDTDMLAATADLYDLPDTTTFTQSQAAGRLLSADEVAAVVEFACTAGPAVHGAVVPAGGGFRP
jgi:SDR family mycofactocin-dependent oxidoreductase